MQTRLAEVRAKADEARIAKLQSEAALGEGLSAAYDFALDAETGRGILKLVETQGLKISSASRWPVSGGPRAGATTPRSPRPKGEAWALRANCPRLACREDPAEGLAAILNGPARGE